MLMGRYLNMGMLVVVVVVYQYWETTNQLLISISLTFMDPTRMEPTTSRQWVDFGWGDPTDWATHQG